MLCCVEHLSVGAQLVGGPQLVVHVERGVDRHKAADAAHTWRGGPLLEAQVEALGGGHRGAEAQQAACLSGIC